MSRSFYLDLNLGVHSSPLRKKFLLNGNNNNSSSALLLSIPAILC